MLPQTCLKSSFRLIAQAPENAISHDLFPDDTLDHWVKALLEGLQMHFDQHGLDRQAAPACDSIASWEQPADRVRAPCLNRGSGLALFLPGGCGFTGCTSSDISNGMSSAIGT